MSAIVQSLEKRLKRVQEAIARIEDNGQEASTTDMSYKEANLETLYKREKELERRLSRKTGRRPLVKQVRVG